MPNNITPITPSRVPIVDVTTGGVNRPWYMFFQSLYENSLVYILGSGGQVTQLTSKSTSVAINTLCGQITMAASSLAASTSVSFTLVNDNIKATDIILVNAANVAGVAPTVNTYSVSCDAVLAGSCRIQVRNISGVAAAQALVLNFAIVKAVNA
jgi:hypothetical protein